LLDRRGRYALARPLKKWLFCVLLFYEFKPVIYRSFADFFCREFRPGVRSFPSNPGDMGAFAEARSFGWPKLIAINNFQSKDVHTALSAYWAIGTAQSDDALCFCGERIHTQFVVRLGPGKRSRVGIRRDLAVSEHFAHPAQEKSPVRRAGPSSGKNPPE
jgi:hypothetical protein